MNVVFNFWCKLEISEHICARNFASRLLNGSSNNTVNNKEVSDFKEPPQGNLNMQIPLEEDNEESKKPEEIEKKEEVTPEEEEDKNDNGNGLTGYEKVTVSNRVKKLQNDGLASLVRLVQKECPNSIKESDDNIEIVDKFENLPT